MRLLHEFEAENPVEATTPEVLVVDDSPENLRYLSEILIQNHCHVRLSQSGEDALNSVAASPPDLILLDVRMPGMDGYEVCRRLKAEPQLRDIPSGS